MALSYSNPGPSISVSQNTVAVYTVGGIIPSAPGSGFNVSITAVLATTQDNYDPAGYLGGVTNRLLLTPQAGGSTLLGLFAASDGFNLLINNSSTTDNIIFAHHSSTQALNQFSCPNGISAVLSPLSSTVVTYVINQWVFS